MFSEGFPEVKSVLVLAPHPDDEALGCSGTLLELRGRRVPVTLVFLTSGEALRGFPSPEVAEIRRGEARASARAMGCGEPLFLDLPDGGLCSCVDKISGELNRIIEDRGQPDIVLAPSPVDHHADHIAAAHAACALLKSNPSVRVAFYEVYSTIRFNCLVDITPVAGEKKRLIMGYRESLYGKAGLYVSVMLGLNAHRALFLQREGYFEAFYVAEKGATMDSLRDHFSYRDICGA